MSIVGNGDIAKVLKNRAGFTFFASGVSNSRETRESEYRRELDLLLKQPKNKRLIYFSSLAVYYADNRYTQHKRQMESTIKEEFPHYTIVRLGNITWGVNPHTLINFLRERLYKGKPLTIRDEYRYIIEKDEFLHWISLISDWNCEMNITGKRMKVQEIVDEYCHVGLSAK